MATIILLNGPAGSGKDTIGNLLHHHYGVMTLGFKVPMFNIALAMLGATRYGQFLEAYHDRERKEKAMTILNGKSPREFFIWLSEDVVKPAFGDEHFGMLYSDAVANSQIPIVCTDCGFRGEVYRLIDDGHKVHLVRLHREGYTFDGDSRAYVHINGNKGGSWTEADIDLVDGDPMDAVRQIHDLYLSGKEHE